MTSSTPDQLAAEAGPLTALAPQGLWSCFDRIRRVPRPSKKEAQIVALVRSWAAEHDFTVRADKAGNLVVAVPARSGAEAAPTVVLQAHLDMVCEKNADSEHDFTRDPITVAVEEDWVVARGTTLGADNGIGVAAAMAVATDPDLRHGPLELLFTLDEETGLNGARALDPSLVTGRLLINLDSEEDGAVYIGCAGAGGALATLPLVRNPRPAQAQPVRLAVRGLRGGHSGIEIGTNRGNAIKIAARVLLGALAAGVEFHLIALRGGDKRNAIPRECFADLLVAPEDQDRLKGEVERLHRENALALTKADADLQVEIIPLSDEEAASPLTPVLRDRLLQLINATPNGVLAMSQEVPGLVQTSNNLALVRTEKDRALVESCCRSSVNASLAATVGSLCSLARLAAAEVVAEVGYPGWKPDPDAPLVARTADAYERCFGRRPAIKAVHAGLECGVLMEKVPGLDAVSIGPEIRGAHSPDERVQISSVASFYLHLTTLLSALTGPEQTPVVP